MTAETTQGRKLYEEIQYLGFHTVFQRPWFFFSISDKSPIIIKEEPKEKDEEVDPLDLEVYEESIENTQKSSEKNQNGKESDKIVTGLPDKSLVKGTLDLEHDCAICSKEFASEENLR